VRDFAVEHIIEKMVGRSLTELFPQVPHTAGEVVLELKDVVLDSGGADPGASLQLRRGEILGLAGIVGAGRTELLRAVFGLEPVRSGKVLVCTLGAAPRPGATPRDRIEQGLGMVSEDRKQEGLALAQSVADNLTYSRLGFYKGLGW